jgi:hypothetical protein
LGCTLPDMRLMDDVHDKVVWSGSRRRRVAAVAVVTVAILVATLALAVSVFAPSLGVPPSHVVGWQLGGQVPGVSVWTGSYWRGGRGFDQKTAQTTTVVPLSMDRWPADCAEAAADWLATPQIAYTPWSVTITMRTRDTFDFAKCRGWYDFWGQPVAVHLSEPLGGRVLLDGSKLPAEARAYP